MAALKEAPDARRAHELAEPVKAMVGVEVAQDVLPIGLNEASRTALSGANAAAGNVVDRCLTATMNLAKGAMGSIASLFMVFAGLRMILGSTGHGRADRPRA